MLVLAPCRGLYVFTVGITLRVMLASLKPNSCDGFHQPRPHHAERDVYGKHAIGFN